MTTEEKLKVLEDFGTIELDMIDGEGMPMPVANPLISVADRGFTWSLVLYDFHGRWFDTWFGKDRDSVIHEAYANLQEEIWRVCWRENNDC